MMKIVPCTPNHPECSDNGRFRLVPDAGWKLSQEFVDHESGLLYASVSSTDESTWESIGHGTRSIPTRHYIIDPETATILAPEQWRTRFDYAEHRRRSPDGTLELVSRRVPSERRNGDDIVEELIEVATGKSLGKGMSHAFRDGPREDMLDCHLRNQREADERQRILDAKVDPATLAAREAAALEPGAVIVTYTDEAQRWQLCRGPSELELFTGVDAEGARLERVRRFASAADFWAFLNPGGRDYLRYRPIQPEDGAEARGGALAACVLAASNALRAGEYTRAQFRQAYAWDHAVWSDAIHPRHQRQHCPHCGSPVPISPRYPTCLCANCCGRTKLDVEGCEVKFGNAGLSGGLCIHYPETGDEDCSQSRCVCLIDGKRYVATEARFGGIVIQREID